MAGAGAYVQSGEPLEMAATIVTLLDDDSRRCDMGAIGRRRIEESFGWEHQAARYLSVYSNAASAS